MGRYDSLVERFTDILDVLKDNLPYTDDKKRRRKDFQIYIPEWYFDKLVKEIRAQRMMNGHTLKITRLNYWGKQRVNFIPENKIIIATFDWHETGEVFEEPITDAFEFANTILK